MRLTQTVLESAQSHSSQCPKTWAEPGEGVYMETSEQVPGDTEQFATNLIQ